MKVLLGWFGIIWQRFYTFKWVLGGVICFYVLMSAWYGMMAVVKHSHYETLADLAIFNQGIWQYSQVSFPWSTFHLERWFLGDHFHPILILLAPFYWIYSGEEVLLVLQPFVLLLAIIPLFLIGYRLTESLFFACAVCFAYAFYLPTQNTLFYDFHEIVFLSPLFAWAYWYYLVGKKWWMSGLLLLLLFVKEEVGFFVATFGLYLMCLGKEWRWWGLGWMIAGGAYSLATMYWLIPAIGGNYLYFDYGSSGETPLAVVMTLIGDPGKLGPLFFSPATKIETLKLTYWPWAYLPLFSPLSLLLAFEQFFTRFLDLRTVVRWTLAYHYSAPMTVVMSIGTIWAVGFYTRWVPAYRKTMIVLIGVCLVILTRIEQINRSAVLLVIYPQFWQRQPWMDTLDEAIAMVPPGVSVATQNNLSPHLSTRRVIYFLDKKDLAEYVVVDFRKGQSPYNFFGEDAWQAAEKQVKDELAQGVYEIVYQKEEVYVLRKQAK